MPTCGEAIVPLLEQFGVEVVFGIPGVHTLELYRGLTGSRIRHITPRHEQGAAFMAAGYGIVSGRPGVCLLITGAGLTNAATAVASAYHDSQPLLILSSATATADAGRGHGSLHDLPDQQRFMASICGSSRTIDRPEQLPDALVEAFTVFDSSRSRPVHIGIPIDVLDQECEPMTLPVAAETVTGTVDQVALERAAELLAVAQNPILLLGGGAVDGGTAALRIAAAVGAPVVTTTNGKGIVPDSHPAALGSTLTLEPVYSALTEADVVLAVGSEFSEVDYYYAPGVPAPSGRLIRIDIDPSQLDRRPLPDVALIGDAAKLLDRLADLLETRTPSTAVALAGERAARLRAGLRWWPDASTYFPVLDAIAAALPDDAVIAADSTQLAYVANAYLPASRPRSYLCPAGFGTLGPALPMAIGAKIAAPQRPVACLVGDGGLLFTIQELATAAELGLPLAVILWQNHGYGEIRDAMTAAGVPHIGTDATAHNYRQIAAGFGCNTARPQTLDHVTKAIATAFAADQPTVIELAADRFLSKR